MNGIVFQELNDAVLDNWRKTPKSRQFMFFSETIDKIVPIISAMANHEGGKIVLRTNEEYTNFLTNKAIAVNNRFFRSKLVSFSRYSHISDEYIVCIVSKNTEHLPFPSKENEHSFAMFWDGTNIEEYTAENLDALKKMYQDIRDGKVPDQHKIYRESRPDHECLNASSLAETITRYLTQSETGEFTLALFGRWGRGKSYLLNKVEEKLKERFPGYRVVRFQPWKHPRRPNLWVSLYQAFMETLKQQSLGEQFTTIFRAGVNRHGLWPLWVWLFTVLFIVTPAKYKITIFHWSLPFISFAGVWAAFSLYRSRASLFGIVNRYFAAPDHRGVLGLQESIGADLGHLLHGWILNRGCAWNLIMNWVGWVLFLFSLFTFLGFFFLQPFLSPVQPWKWLASYFPDQVPVFDSYYFSVLPFGELLVGALLASLLLAPFIMWRYGKTERVILMIDDLDRCPVEDILSVVEDIKLLLESSSMQKRLRVVFALDEEIFSQALMQRFKEIDDQQLKEQRAWQHTKKLFLGWIRLPELSDQELGEVVEKFTSSKDGMLTDIELAQFRQTLAKVENAKAGMVPRDVRHLLHAYYLARSLAVAKGSMNREFSPMIEELVRQDYGASSSLPQREGALTEAVASALEMVHFKPKD